MVDTFNLCRFHDLLGPFKRGGVNGGPVPITKFAGVLSQQIGILAKRQTAIATYPAVASPSSRYGNRIRRCRDIVDGMETIVAIFC